MKRKLNTRKYNKRLLYGGNPPASMTDIFSKYNPDDVRLTLTNFLQAAYSVYQAALAIKETSDNQNKPTTDATDATRGTRYLQRDSSASFLTAADSIERSLNNLYMALSDTSVGPTLSPAAATPTDPEWNPPV
jgi:predicted trehalose synthase